MGGSALFQNVAAPLVTQALPAIASGAMQVGRSAVENILVPVVRETVNQVIIPGLQGAASAGIEAGRLSLEHGPGIASAVGSGLAVAGSESAKVAARAGVSLFQRLTKLIEEQGAQRQAALLNEQSAAFVSKRRRGSSPPQAASGPAMLEDMPRSRSPPQSQPSKSQPSNPVTQQTGFDGFIQHLPSIEAWSKSKMSKNQMVEQLAGRRGFMDLLGENVKDPKKMISKMPRAQLAALLVQYDQAHGHI
jgi:hypothetical protein